MGFAQAFFPEHSDEPLEASAPLFAPLSPGHQLELDAREFAPTEKESAASNLPSPKRLQSKPSDMANDNALGDPDTRNRIAANTVYDRPASIPDELQERSQTYSAAISASSLPPLASA